MTGQPYHEEVNRLASHVMLELQTTIDEHIGETFPSLSIAVIYKGGCILNAAWGWIDPETPSYEVTPETLFDLASVTKPFTATAFLGLVSEGKVQLDDPIITVLPEFAESGLRPLDGGQDPHSKVHLPTPDEVKGQSVDPSVITFRQLLTHTSGLAPWRDVYNAAGAPPTPPDVPDPIARDERWKRGLAAICHYPFVGQPGEKVRYSDLGLMLLGESVARLHGTPGKLDVAVQERVLTPLKLTSITYNPVRNGRDRSQVAMTEDDPLWRKRRCWGEVHDENACGIGGVAGHAGLFATASDVALFGQAWLERDPRLGISPAVADLAVQEHATDGIRRGLGWMLRAYEDSSAGEVMTPATFGHTGFTGPTLWIDPEHQLVVACLNNRVYPGREKPGVHEFRKAVHNIIAKGLYTQ